MWCACNRKCNMLSLISLFWFCCICLALHAADLASAQVPAVSLTSSVEQDGRQVACPGEVVTFTCMVTDATSLLWVAEPHIRRQHNPIFFSISDNPGDESAVLDDSGQFRAVLTNVLELPNGFVDFTSELTVNASETLQGTEIDCFRTRGTTETSMTTILTVAAPPFPSCTGESTVPVMTTDEGPTAHTNDSVTVGCGPPTPPLNGSLGDITSSPEGEVVTIQCNPGLVPSQEMMSVCTNGSWTPDPAELRCIQDGCGMPASPTNGCGMPASPTNGTVNCTSNATEGSQTCHCSTDGGLLTGLSTAEVIGVTFVLSSIVSFTAGLLVALVIAHCHMRQQKSQYPSRDTQQSVPTYEEISTAACTSKKIELKENAAYGPVDY